MAKSGLKRVPAIFYRSEAENEPVRDWLKRLDRGDQREIGNAIRRVEYGWPIGMPVCRPMGEGLHEVRVNLQGNRIGRVIFYIDRLGRMVLLHGFIKKTRTTPLDDLVLARANRRKHERGLP